MGIVDDLSDRLEAKRSCQSRIYREKAWLEAARLVYPQSPMALLGGAWPKSGATGKTVAKTTAADNSATIYDSTALLTARQLTNGVVSLLTPTTSYWHDLVLANAMSGKVPQEIEEWLERIRDYLFKVRYNPATGFAQANQAAIRQAVVFGNGLYRVKELKGNQKNKPFVYRYLPLSSTYIAVDAQGVHNETDEARELTARQAVMNFGYDAVSAKVQQAYDKKDNKDKFEFVHAIHPRDEKGSRKAKTNLNSAYASYIFESDSKHLVEESGYEEFPDIKYGWEDEPGEAYSTGPVEIVLATIKQTNSIAKSMLVGGQKSVEPSWLTPANPVSGMGVNGLPAFDSRPNAMNPGYLGPQGQELIKPAFQVRDPSWAQGLLEQGRQAIREGLFMHLFQVLQDNPNQSATEALIREQEKGELLGPVGQSIQAGLSTLVDREIGVLQRKGVFDTDLAPPMDIGLAEFGPEYTSPLDRARKASQAVGIQRSLEIAMQIAQFQPEIMANYNLDEIIHTTSDILGAPKKILRSTDERDQLLNQQKQLEETQQALSLLQQGGDAVTAGAMGVASGADAVNAIAGAVPAGQDLAGLIGQAQEEPAEPGFIDLDQTEFGEAA